MADPVAWPSGLLWFAEHSSWTEMIMPATRQTSELIGPNRVRRRNTLTGFRLQFSRVIYTAELEQFLDFYHDDLYDGAVNFIALDPRTEEYVEYQFMAEPTWQDVAPGAWRIRFQLYKVRTVVDPELVLDVAFDGADGAVYTPDLSPSKHALTFDSPAQLDTAQKVTGISSLLLNGASFVSAPSGTDWQFGTGDFTVHCWHRGTALSGYRVVIGYVAITGNQRSWALITQNDGGAVDRIYASLSYDGTVENNLSSANNAIVVNTWQHIALTRASGVVRLFVGGVLLNSSTIAGSLFNSTAPLMIGALPDASAGVTGNIDQVRVIKGRALWTAAFTPPGA